MEWLSPIELVGYAASALIVISLAMRSVVKLRTVSLIGSLVFVTYGVLIGAIPIILSNAIIAVINIVYLGRELQGPKARFGAVPIEPDAPFLTDFLDSHLDDIRRAQPDFVAVHNDDTVLLLLRDGLPAGAVAGRITGGTLDVDLDYVMRAYRDSRIGRWLFGAGRSVLTDLGVRRVSTPPGSALHRAYLSGIGFRPEDDRMVLKLE